MNPKIQPTSPLDLAGALVAAPAAGQGEMEVLMCLGVVLICLACVCTRLPWVLDKVATSVEKQFGPSAVYGKSNRAADSLCTPLFALVHSVVEEGEVLGVEFAGDDAINRGLEVVNVSGLIFACQLTSNVGGLKSHDSQASYS